jgi:hypothetical protein
VFVSDRDMNFVLVVVPRVSPVDLAQSKLQFKAAVFPG